MMSGQNIRRRSALAPQHHGGVWRTRGHLGYKIYISLYITKCVFGIRQPDNDRALQISMASEFHSCVQPEPPARILRITTCKW